MAKQTIEYKVGIYLRLSQEDMRSGESLSIEHQREIVALGREPVDRTSA